MSKSKFPRDEAGVLALAREMADGFTAHADIYPAPPIGAEDFEAALKRCEGSRDAVQEAKSALEEAVSAKNAAFEVLDDHMHTRIRYAENTVHFDDAKLKLIGWSGRKAPSSLKIPGQALSLAVRGQSEGSVTLVWKKPGGGGKVATYRIERKECGQGAAAWASAEMAMEAGITLSGQDRGKELEYRVLAVNRAGEGEPSNTVTVIL